MASDNRKFQQENPSEKGGSSDIQKIRGNDPNQSQYGDHPILGDDGQPLARELLRSPQRDGPDPVAKFPADPEREASRKVVEIRGAASRNPDLEYQPPNPMTVVPPANIPMKLFGAVVAVILFAFVLWLMFHNWMIPGARHPGAQKPAQTLEQKIP